jgi:hypothetical protein
MSRWDGVFSVDGGAIKFVGVTDMQKKCRYAACLFEGFEMMAWILTPVKM